ncbi:MAG: DUF3160 domain-containing protein [Pseudomonadota bacterium]
MTFHLSLALLLLAGPADTSTTAPQREPIPARVAALPEGGCVATPEVKVPGRNPRFLPGSDAVVFEVGRAGAADLHVLDLTTGAVRPLVVGPGDDCDADPSPDGERVVFASDRKGSYDLWTVPVQGGAPVRLTEGASDERRPRWSPVPYRLLGVHPDGCDGPYTSLMDDYGKILYERRKGDAVDALWISDNGLHGGPLGKGCASPSWLPWGAGVLLTCESRLVALETARVAGIKGAIEASGWTSDSWEAGGFPDVDFIPEDGGDAALAEFLRKNPKLKRLYSVYEGRRALSGRRAGLAAPLASPNRLLVLAEGGSGVSVRPLAGDAAWGVFGLPEGAAAPHWSPDGTRVAFHMVVGGRDRIHVAATTCPLQGVLNLTDAPELVRGGPSGHLVRRGMVAFPGDEREFFHLYENLRYADAGILVTPDAVLQVASDLLAAAIQEREETMTGTLRELTEALWTWALAAHRAAPKDPALGYLVTYLAVPRILLSGARAQAAALEQDDAECFLVPDMGCPEEAMATWKAERDAAVAAAGAKALAEVPDGVRGDVERLLDRLRGASGVGKYGPGAHGAPQGFAVDWTLFTPRSHYTRPEFRDYFLAMSWYGNVPLPAHPVSLRLSHHVLDDPELASRWHSLDDFASAAVGGAARPTLTHLEAALKAHPRWAERVDAAVLLDDLDGRIGRLPIRGANETFGYRGMQPYLLPPRLGPDVGIIVGLTHPEVALRGMPTLLDVLAALGNGLAEVLAGTPPEGERWAASDWRAALAATRRGLAGRGVGYWTENLYNRWLDTLRILADDAGIVGPAAPAWVGSELYRARLLTASLAGLTQLKHHTVLYNMNPMGVECDASSPIVALYEEPILPEPPMSVEPHPEFYRALADLAVAAGTALGDGELAAPDLAAVRASLGGAPWDPGSAFFTSIEGGVPAEFFGALVTLARMLESASRRVLAGEPLAPEEAAVVKWFGGILERFLLRQTYLEDSMVNGTDQGRAERGITLVTDIYHNPQRGQILEVGIGTIDRLYAVVPWLHGQGIVQGGMFSWYEFPESGGKRLTDETWWSRIQAGTLPPRPGWSARYLQEDGE